MTRPRKTASASISLSSVKQVIFLGIIVALAGGLLLQLAALKNIHQDEPVRTSSNDLPVKTELRQPASILRTRMLEANVMEDLTQAYRPVKDLIQPPLGEGTSSSDPSLNPYSKDWRGTDMSLPEQATLRSNRIIYMITPTHKRQTQMVDLTRVSQTLRLAKEAGYHERLYWIILEDADYPSHRVREVAIQSGLTFAHKAVKTSLADKKRFKAHRGLDQRNTGLDIIEELGAEGVVYMLDDDNAYNVQLFHELSYTTHVGVFGVGLPGGSAYERCRVDPQTGKVDKLLTTWEAPRTFALDMAGFAFATHHLARATAAGKKMRFSQKSLPGFLENDLVSFAASTIPELQPLAANCTRILTWHVKTVGNDLLYNPEDGSDKKTKFDLMFRLV